MAKGPMGSKAKLVVTETNFLKWKERFNKAQNFGQLYKFSRKDMLAALVARMEEEEKAELAAQAAAPTT